MNIDEIRKSIISTSSNEFIEEISNYFFNGNFSNKGISDVRNIFAYSHNNQSERNEDDFKHFYDKVAYVDFCNFNNMGRTAFAAKKYLAAAFNPKTHEFSYDSNKFYKEGNNSFDTLLILNVKGEEIYKVLSSLYTCLRDNGIDNCITIPSYNRFKEGLTDSIRISINVADMERVVKLISDLPLPIINLIDKPSMLYPRVNDYIGYDAILKVGDRDIRASYLVCQSISKALYNTVMDFLDRDGKETIENDAETIQSYRKKCLDKGESLVECDLRILQRMIAIDPTNRNVFIKNLKDSLLGSSMTKSAYISKEINDLFDEIYGKLDDESILFNAELEFDVETPSVEVAENVTLNQVPMVASSSDLLVPEEQQTDLLVPEEQQTDLMVQQEQQTDLLVQEETPKDLLVTDQPADAKPEETLYQSFMNRTGSSEAYLDSLLASMNGENEKVEETAKSEPVEEHVQADTSLEEEVVQVDGVQEGPQVSVATAENEKPLSEEDVHFYETAPSVGENFVLSSTEAEATKVEEVQEVAPATENTDLVRPEDMTEEQKKLISDTFSELPTEDTRLFDYLDGILNKFPESEAIEESKDQEDTLDESTLNAMEVESLSSNPLDEHLTYERALKYKDLVSSISILNTKVRGTDFTLLDYFDQQQLLSKINPNSSYLTFTDEVYTGLEVVENCVIKYVANYGNVPLDKIMEEYGIQELMQKEKTEKRRGLKDLFRKKRS